MKEYLIYVVYIIFAVLVIYGIQKKPINIHEKKEYLTRLNSLRGLLALDIMIGHVAGQNMFPLMPFEKFSIVSVASFFFLSGMGLTNSYYKKENYLTKIPEKIIYLIGVTMILYLIKIGVQLISGWNLDYVPGSVSDFIKLYFIKTNWYIWELIIFYITFALVYKFIHFKAFKVLTIFIISFVLGVYFLLNNFIVAWYYSILGFPLGILFSEYFVQFVNFIHRSYGRLTIGGALISGVIGHVLLADNIVGSYITRNLFCMTCIVIIILIIEQFKINNKIIECFTTLSLELYLYHSLYLDLTQNIADNYLFRLLIVFVCSFCTSFFMHRVNIKIKKLCSKLLYK